MQIEFWHWLILGLVLLVLEVVTPAMILLWFGVGALLTGVLHWLLPDLGLGWQSLFFATFSLLSVLAWRKFRPETHIKSDIPELNNRLASHIGKEYVLSEALEHGRGMARVGDSEWRVESTQDLPAGTRIRVTGVNGVILNVEKATT
ncbi:NfeD family protein [Thiolinea disciformis]|uniref:NfeD family protein n=1 Tax=Thiolinea disciformis TaxID=125614 RepID=UPI0003710AB2|nr:NfeD family protein [Thiolinea disciformis]